VTFLRCVAFTLIVENFASLQSPIAVPGSSPERTTRPPCPAPPNELRFMPALMRHSSFSSCSPSYSCLCSSSYSCSFRSVKSFSLDPSVHHVVSCRVVLCMTWFILFVCLQFPFRRFVRLCSYSYSWGLSVPWMVVMTVVGSLVIHSGYHLSSSLLVYLLN